MNAGQESNFSWMAAAAGLCLFVAVAVAGSGYYAFVRYNETTFETKWNARYSQPTFPLDDDPATTPDPNLWATP